VRYKNNIGPQMRRRRYALGWSQSNLATKLKLAGFDISRSGVSKIEARLSYVDDKTLLYLAEVLKVPVQDLFPRRTPGNRVSRLHGEAGDDAVLNLPTVFLLHAKAAPIAKNKGWKAHWWHGPNCTLDCTP
jgi:transcriptional regulator with XRE-family HTH domain